MAPSFNQLDFWLLANEKTSLWFHLFDFNLWLFNLVQSKKYFTSCYMTHTLWLIQYGNSLYVIFFSCPFSLVLQCFHTVSHFSCSCFNILPLNDGKFPLAPSSGMKNDIKMTRKNGRKNYFNQKCQKCHFMFCKQLIDFLSFLCSRIFPFCLSRISIFFSSSILFSLSVLKKARFSEKIWLVLDSKSGFRSDA